MYSALEYVCWAALLASVPILLTLKFSRQGRLPWWSVIVAVAVISTLLSVARDYVGPLAHAERFDSCIEENPADPVAQTEPDCGPVTYHVWSLPIHLKWTAGFILLAACMPFYGVATWLRKRRSRVSAA